MPNGGELICEWWQNGSKFIGMCIDNWENKHRLKSFLYRPSIYETIPTYSLELVSVPHRKNVLSDYIFIHCHLDRVSVSIINEHMH